MDQHDEKIIDAEESYGLSTRLFDEVLDAIEADDAPAIDAALEPLHAADIADLIEQLNTRDRRALLQLWPNGVDGEILSELDENLRDEVIAQLNPDQLAEAVRDLESDDVVDLVEYLDAPQQEAVLDALDASDRVAVEKALAYPEESAGRLMQVEVAKAPEHWTVGEAIDFLRSDIALPDQFYHLVLVDPRMRPIGQATLGRILSSARATPLKDILEETFITFNVNDDEGDVARAFNQYHLISSPVVDSDDRLVGVITIDDAMIVLDEEHTEDMLRLAGVGENATISDSVFETVKQRFPWLFVNLITVNIAALIVGLFDQTIAAYVALAALMPVVASMGGSAGTQSLTVAVRAIATNDLTASNAWRVIRREMFVGLLNGLVFAVVMGAVGTFGYGSALLGLTLALAMLINLVVAALAGVLVPVVLDKLKLDPALASGTFVTTTTDMVGFFAFLGLATVILL
ncbi:magnesium transporter [Ketogulonicigenium vulgare]|uniref:Magnesium transporter MgtE n=1 Tax=Ketogulonicigenium vulgare (strain WSH-001) TaxID=759362 RepID=F9Y3K2_KETVW|nr:magnesium transporter [Ketogulonicigenium vulgare]ADO43335.1 magnesium transporter [Ketogulonicigenium vulgare Y25]AEM41622.1 Magnesium transporter [Ketogulonicigenium vulgare WSH-001]ALJ81737.1 magnesium transporter [Ketogulonicigenium vulgare]ANW34400.1 magnesium transporter [Ketogulonicigenium vulgare]AOZ55372.1 magnesium transporter [Ketogulonicigenium vulgare]